MDCAEDGSEATAGGSHYGDTEEALRDIVNPPSACAFLTRRSLSSPFFHARRRMAQGFNFIRVHDESAAHRPPVSLRRRPDMQDAFP